MRCVPVLLLVMALTGCGMKEATEEPGARGPLILRWWDQAALHQQAPPTVLTAERLAETGPRLAALDLTPIRIRHPVEGGVVWVDAPSGSFDRQAGATNRLRCPGPVRIHGWIQGRPLVGTAESARVAAGGKDLELADLVLVQGGRLTTTPLARLARGHGSGTGPLLIRPGAPAIRAALAAVPTP